MTLSMTSTLGCGENHNVEDNFNVMTDDNGFKIINMEVVENCLPVYERLSRYSH